MSVHFADLGTLTIASGATGASTAITKYLDDAKTVSVYAPSALTGTITVQISFDGTTYGDLTSGGSDVTIAAGNVLVITDPGFLGLRVSSGGTEAAARTFTVSKTFVVGR